MVKKRVVRDHNHKGLNNLEMILLLLKDLKVLDENFILGYNSAYSYCRRYGKFDL